MSFLDRMKALSQINDQLANTLLAASELILHPPAEDASNEAVDEYENELYNLIFEAYEIMLDMPAKYKEYGAFFKKTFKISPKEYKEWLKSAEEEEDPTVSRDPTKLVLPGVTKEEVKAEEPAPIKTVGSASHTTVPQPTPKISLKKKGRA